MGARRGRAAAKRQAEKAAAEQARAQVQRLWEVAEARGLADELSRGLAGVAGRTLIVNLPGSTGGARDGQAVLGPILAHAVDQLRGGDH